MLYVSEYEGTPASLLLAKLKVMILRVIKKDKYLMNQ